MGAENAIVFTTGVAPESYSCVRSLSERGVRTLVATEGMGCPVASSRYCDETFTVCAPDTDLIAYKKALLNVAKRSDVQTILPLRSADPYVFAKYREEFEEYITLLTPPLESVRRVHDRNRLVKTAEEVGVPVPESQLLTETGDWDSEQVIKSRYNFLADEYCPAYSKRDAKTVKTVKHLRAGDSPDVEAVCDEMDHVPIVQEYVHSSDEYVFGALYDSGEPVATFQHRQIRGNSYTGGGGVYRESVDIPELDAVGRTLLDHLDWHGLACIEYARDADTGEFKLIEINPRIWQSIPCAMSAGVDFPYYCWLQATGRSELIEADYETGVGTHLLYGELGHLVSTLTDDSPLVDRPSVPQTAWQIAKSCYERPYFDDFHIDDPLPFIRGLEYFLKKSFSERT